MIRKASDWNGGDFNSVYFPSEYIEREIINKLASSGRVVTYQQERIYCSNSEGGSVYCGGEEIFLQFVSISDGVVQYIGERPLSDTPKQLDTEKYSKKNLHRIISEYTEEHFDTLALPTNFKICWFTYIKDEANVRASLYLKKSKYDSAKKEQRFKKEGINFEIILHCHYYEDKEQLDYKIEKAWEALAEEAQRLALWASNKKRLSVLGALEALEEHRANLLKLEREKQLLTDKEEPSLPYCSD